MKRRTLKAELATVDSPESLGRPGAGLAASLIVGAFLLGAPTAYGQVDSVDRLTIIAPADLGSGWDQTARAMQRALLESRLAKRVDVANHPGAGGTLGLVQFVHAHQGDPTVILTGGLALIGSVRANGATVSVLDTTPIARLMGEDMVVLVPADSEFETLEELLGAFKAHPGRIAWAAGHQGGVDHLLVALIAQALEIPLAQANVLPSAGGGEALKALLGGHASAGVSGLGEAQLHIRSGRLKALAVAAQQRPPGVAIPTLKERGVNVVLSNWRGVLAAPGISPAERNRLIRLLDAMTRGDPWRRSMLEHGWMDLYLPGDAFVDFISTETAWIAAGPDLSAGGPVGRVTSGTPFWKPAFVVLLILTLGLIAVVRKQKDVARRREQALSHDLGAAREEAERRGQQAQELFARLGEEIDRQFQAWSLSTSEREVGLLLLKGLRHKEIARVRNTSEPTVRHQALAIYKKAGLEGRTDLAAHFLKDQLQSSEPVARSGTPEGRFHRQGFPVSSTSPPRR